MIYSIEEIWGKSDHSPQSMKISKREALISCGESDPGSHEAEIHILHENCRV